MIKKEALYIETRDYFLTQKRFEISKTSVDGVLITTPQPRDLDKFYDTTDYLSHDDSDTTLFAQLYRFARKLNLKTKFKLISKYDEGERVLDVGAGNGELVRYLVDQKLDAQGYEPNPLARKIAYQKGVRLLDHLPTSNVFHYKVIQMFHVLEHVRDPKKLLNDLHSMLEKDGVLIIALPNFLSLDARIFGKYWAGLDVPRHLYHFNKNGIVNLAKEQFELEKTKPMWFDSFYVSILSARYKKMPLAFISGIFVGMLSNIVAICNSQPSSRIYIFRKRK